MAQAFWDENKQREWEEWNKKLLEQRKEIYLNWAKQVADRFVEIDLPERKQLMKKVIEVLEKNNIDFEVDNYKIKIKGNLIEVRLAGFMGGPEWIEIRQGDKTIIWETHMDYSILYVKPLGSSKVLGGVELPRDIPRVYYIYPNLYIFF
jgi:hypothetical protein